MPRSDHTRSPSRPRCRRSSSTGICDCASFSPIRTISHNIDSEMLPKSKNWRRQQKAHGSACSHSQGEIVAPTFGVDSILPHLEDAPGTPRAPEGVIAQPFRTTILVEPCFDPVEPGAQPIRRNADPNTHRKASFSLGDHEPGTSSHQCVLILFARRLAFAQHARKVHRWQRQHAAHVRLDGLLTLYPYY